MTTTPEQRGYSRGYYAGCRRSDAEKATERERAELAARRAEQAETANGVGHCEDCRHWQQGAGMATPSVCAWGVCRAPRGAGTPWGCWVSGRDGQDGNFQTTPRFGCVLFIAKDTDHA